MSDEHRTFGQLVAAKVAELTAGGAHLASPVHVSAYHRAAAMLASFEEGLRPDGDVSMPGGEDEREGLYSVILDATLFTTKDGRSRYVLDPSIRRYVLHAMGIEAAIAARHANDGDPLDPRQRVLDTWLAKGGTPVKLIAATDLPVAFEVASWLEGTPIGEAIDAPDPSVIRERLEAEQLLAPFELLVGDHFGGREEELATLRDYVGALPPSSAWSWATQVVRETFNLNERPPLVIYGPGGLGKSTLVAKFILDHARVDEGRRFPYVYLDFDRAELIAAEPLTMLLEAVRQIGAQLPQYRAVCKRLRDDWHQEVLRARQSVRGRTVSGRERFIREFANLLTQIEMMQRPLLFVLDTFEEVQYRSKVFVAETWKFLSELQAAVPRLRTVIVGRAALEGFPQVPLPLRDLDLAAAQGFLQQRGIPAASAAWLASRLGGNPLTLRLATQLFQHVTEGKAEDGLAGFDTMAFAGRVDAGEIQRQLYVRILNHIHDADVRKLAHPGLLLRTLTPEIVYEVLAEPCGVKAGSLERARQLFDELARETSLVSVSGVDELRHRPDVRRVMLKSLRGDPAYASRIPEIHKRAIDFYARRYERTHASADRAEEIFHRLALGRASELTEARWVAGVESSLYNAVEELPAASRAWLAARLRVELDPEARGVADLDVWERDAARRAGECLAVWNASGALDVINERSERSEASPLLLLEARALRIQGDHVSARDKLRKARERMFQAGRPLPRLEITMELVNVELHLGRALQAREYFAEAQALSGVLDDAPVRLRLRVAEDELRKLELREADERRGGARSGDQAERDRRNMADAEFLVALRGDLDRLTDDQMRAEPEVVRAAAARLPLVVEPILAARVVR
jgi:cellulose synthase operon protein C